MRRNAPLTWSGGGTHWTARASSSGGGAATPAAAERAEGALLFALDGGE